MDRAPFLMLEMGSSMRNSFSKLQESKFILDMIIIMREEPGLECFQLEYKGRRRRPSLNGAIIFRIERL